MTTTQAPRVATCSHCGDEDKVCHPDAEQVCGNADTCLRCVDEMIAQVTLCAGCGDECSGDIDAVTVAEDVFGDPQPRCHRCVDEAISVPSTIEVYVPTFVAQDWLSREMSQLAEHESGPNPYAKVTDWKGGPVVWTADEAREAIADCAYQADPDGCGGYHTPNGRRQYRKLMRAAQAKLDGDTPPALEGPMRPAAYDPTDPIDGEVDPIHTHFGPRASERFEQAFAAMETTDEDAWFEQELVGYVAHLEAQTDSDDMAERAAAAYALQAFDQFYAHLATANPVVFPS